MRTIGRIGVRAALLVGFTLALGTPAAHAQGLPPTGVGPVDDVVDDVGDLLPEPPPVALPAAPEAPPLPVPDPSGAVPGLPAPPSGAPGSPPVAAPDLGGLPAPGGLPGPDAPADLGAIPDPGGLPTLCGLGSGVPDADVVDCVLTTLLGGDAPGILEPPDAVCDLNGTLGGILDPVCRDDPGGSGNPGGPDDPGGGGGADGDGDGDRDADPAASVDRAMLARTGVSPMAGLLGLSLAAGGGLVLWIRRFVRPA